MPILCRNTAQHDFLQDARIGRVNNIWSCLRTYKASSLDFSPVLSLTSKLTIGESNFDLQVKDFLSSIEENSHLSNLLAANYPTSTSIWDEDEGESAPSYPYLVVGRL